MGKPLNINTIDELAVRLQVDKGSLEIIIPSVCRCYKTKRIFENGKYRILDIPGDALKKIQKLINKRLLQKIKLPDTIQGSKKKGSIKKNAEIHAGQRIIGNLDIKDFFPSVRSKRVEDIFIKIGCAPVIARLLMKLTTWKNRLPQGAPTSSSIANLILLNMDKRFKSLCEIHGIKYSFYVDDITISGNQRVEKLRNLFCKIIKQEGFEVNPDKIRFNDKGERQTVTNLVINSGEPNVLREYHRTLRAIIHNCATYGPSTQTKTRVEDFKQSLMGKINYVLSINKRMGYKLLKAFEKINWTA